MIDHDGAWLPSVTIGLPILGVLTLASLAITVIAILASVIKDYRGHRDHEHWVIAWLAPAALLGLLIGSGAGYWPWGGDYHRLQPATGTVQSVDTRFLAASQYVVVTYDTGLIVRCDDSRCATVTPGEQLRLLCTKEHQFGSPLAADGWGCRWGQAP
ncbi:hypothetical protein [Actinoplanes siamensis]|uniref:Uncharacterized protein n=1 Tax=Actinoplanes siamensis TaxID=1223317 RepID=A0A919NDG2_9ACTN|nr:hypothetical protein [Actinoplanes siamensis]GIF08699.1 hypothetical protein Asi03nite_62370 [Actinoplanes siamensis]